MYNPYSNVATNIQDLNWWQVGINCFSFEIDLEWKNKTKKSSVSFCFSWLLKAFFWVEKRVGSISIKHFWKLNTKFLKKQKFIFFSLVNILLTYICFKLIRVVGQTEFFECQKSHSAVSSNFFHKSLIFFFRHILKNFDKIFKNLVNWVPLILVFIWNRRSVEFMNTASLNLILL